MKKIALLLSPLSLSVFIFLFCQLQVYSIFSGLLDEGFLVYNAHLISQGQIPYRDFFMTSTPGSYYVVAFFFKYFGNYMIVTRILGIASAILTLVICNQLFKLKKYWQYIYLISMAFLLIAPSRFFFYNEAFFVSLVALFFLIKATEKNNLLLFCASGLISGLCFVMKQSVGGLLFPAFILGIFLVSGRKNVLKAVSAYIIGWAVVLAPVTAYFYLNNALPQALYFIFSFANAVKSHQSSFLVHRLIAIPIIVLLFMLLRNVKPRTRLLLLSLSLLSSVFYLLLNTRRIGRLLTYLPDPVFYVQTLAFIFPLIILAFYLRRRTIHEKKVTLAAISYLVMFLSLAASGYSSGPGVVVAPLLIPLFIYFTEKYGNKLLKNKKATILLTTVIILVYTITFSYNPLRFQTLESQYTASLNIKEAKYILFTPSIASDLMRVISYIQKNTKKDEKIFCFPYCPGLLFFSERDGGSFYNLFWFETFMEKDQNSVIQDLEKNKVRLIILEKSKDDIRLQSMIEAEEKRLPEIKGYIIKNYQKVLVTDNFILLKR